MFITIITDCTSQNDKGRQETRFFTFFKKPVSFIGIESTLSTTSTIEAAGNLIDVLDAGGNEKGVIVLNVAPRGDVSDGNNGNPFCFFCYKNTLVISSVKGYSLSLVKKLGLCKLVKVLNSKDVLEYALQQKFIDEKLKTYVENTQFRSFDFVPRVAKWITEGHNIPFKYRSINQFPSVPPSIWLKDSFGNVKTTLLKKDLKLDGSGKIKTNFGSFNFYEGLKDLPKLETAMYVGSSGINGDRFVEIASQGIPGSAAKKLNLNIGDKIEIL